MNPNDFLFRENFYACIDVLPIEPNPYIRLAVTDTLLSYGVRGSFDFSKFPLSEEEKREVEEISYQMLVSISDSKERYRKAVANGKKGGRPRKKRDA